MDALIRHLEKLLQELVAQRHVRHALVAVESASTAFRWHGAAGVADADGARVHADTPFFIASIDKLLIATIVLKLQERGGLPDLAAPLAHYLGSARIAGIHRWRGTDYTHALTLRHLLTHTSGLPDWLEDRPRDGPSLVERVLMDGDMAFDFDAMIHFVRDQLTPHFPPQPAARPRVRYCDTNFMLLMAVIEAVTGQPLHRVYEALLFRPLQMCSTWLPGRSEPAAPTRVPATLWAAGRPLAIARLLQSMRGVYSTTADLLAFLRALTRGALFDDPATLQVMLQRWHRFGFALDAAALRAPQWPIEYGLGVMRFRVPRLFAPLAAVPAVIGHTGSTGTWLFHCPERDMLTAGTVDEAGAGAVPFRFVPKLLRALAHR